MANCKYTYKGITYSSKEEFISQVINPQFLSSQKVRRVMELQSDLFQKGRDLPSIAKLKDSEGLIFQDSDNLYFAGYSEKEIVTPKFKTLEELYEYLEKKPITEDKSTQNQFLQLLNKNNNWVTFFVKSIIQDTAKQTITEVQESDVEDKVRELEKEGLLEIDCKGFKAKDGLKTTFTKGGKWKIIKDLKGYPTHKEGGVDLTIGKEGVKIKNGNTEFIAKHGLVIPKN